VQRYLWSTECVKGTIEIK